jgi:hypothetical protein
MSSKTALYEHPYKDERTILAADLTARHEGPAAFIALMAAHCVCHDEVTRGDVVSGCLAGYWGERKTYPVAWENVARAL